MPHMQATRAEARQQVNEQVQAAIAAARDAARQAQQAAQSAVEQAGTAPEAIAPVPPGGGRLVIERQGDRTVFTSAAVPPEVIPIVSMVQDTALGLMGLLAAMVILGPLARVFARRIDRRTEIMAAAANTQLLEQHLQQLQQLQQSMDVMSLEVERIGEAQRFQSKLLHGKS